MHNFSIGLLNGLAVISLNVTYFYTDDMHWFICPFVILAMKSLMLVCKHFIFLYSINIFAMYVFCFIFNYHYKSTLQYIMLILSHCCPVWVNVWIVQDMSTMFKLLFYCNWRQAITSDIIHTQLTSMLKYYNLNINIIKIAFYITMHTMSC